MIVLNDFLLAASPVQFPKPFSIFSEIILYILRPPECRSKNQNHQH